jgi:hypothetical protein
MPGPGTGPRPGGWETLLYSTEFGGEVFTGRGSLELIFVVRLYSISKILDLVSYDML